MHNNHVRLPLLQLIPFTARQELCRTRPQAISINFQDIHASSSEQVTEHVITSITVQFGWKVQASLTNLQITCQELILPANEKKTKSFKCFP